MATKPTCIDCAAKAGFNVGSKWNDDGAKSHLFRIRAKTAVCGIKRADLNWHPPTWIPMKDRNGRLSDKSRAATIALVKTLAADLSTDTGHYAQTVASLGAHVQTLAADRAAMQGFGVTDRAGRKS